MYNDITHNLKNKGKNMNNFNLETLKNSLIDLEGEKLIAYSKRFVYSSGVTEIVVEVLASLEEGKISLECRNKSSFYMVKEANLTVTQMEEMSQTLLTAKNYFQMVNSWIDDSHYSGVNERLLVNLNKEFSK